MLGSPTRRAALLGIALGAAGCVTTPPPSQFPDARAAIDRMRATYACSRGIVGEAKLDYVGDEGRIRASMMFLAARPERSRIDVYSSFGATLSTFTTDGKQFALSDVKAKKYFYGPAHQCAVSRFLGIPVPPHALVQLLAGEAPVLVHAPPQASIAWSSGAYQVQISGQYRSRETISLVPHPEDWEKPWREQRLRVLEVHVEQEGVAIYDATFSDHQPASLAPPRVDPDGLEADVPPSGPQCMAEIPRRIRFVVPGSGRDVELRHQEVQHNPPLVPGQFSQPRARGLQGVGVQCAQELGFEH